MHDAVQLNHLRVQHIVNGFGTDDAKGDFLNQIGGIVDRIRDPAGEVEHLATARRGSEYKAAFEFTVVMKDELIELDGVAEFARSVTKEIGKRSVVGVGIAYLHLQFDAG